MTTAEILLEVQSLLLDEANRGEHTDGLSPRDRGILHFAVGAAYQESEQRERARARARREAKR